MALFERNIHSQTAATENSLEDVTGQEGLCAAESETLLATTTSLNKP